MTSKFSPALNLLLKQAKVPGRRLWWLSMIFWLILVAPVRAALDLRVAIKEDVNQVTVGSSTPAVVRDAATGQTVGQLTPMQGFEASQGAAGVMIDNRWKAGQFWVEPTEGGLVWIGDRWYRGKTLLLSTSKGLTAVNYVNLEHYLYSVLGGEMNGNWPQEALKAQAVAARSYVLHQRRKAANRAYDVGNTTTWQVYRGVADESQGTQMAVNATAGQVLTHNGQIIEAVFHSASGGHTENVEDVWTQPLPYLRGVPDFDQGAPVYQWEKAFSRSELSSRITGVGNIISMTPVRTSPYGRVMTMRVVGDAGTRELSGDRIRHALGLRSARFEVTPQYGPVASTGKLSSAPTAFQIRGRGFGHGLGLSQWGAHNMAQKGYNYQQIVLHYYKNTTLGKIDVK